MSVNALGHQGLTRRSFLVGGASLGAAAALGVSVAGTPFGATKDTIAFWHLFGGGDGARMTAMLAQLHKQQPKLDIRSLILPWGNPYYTKLSIAAVGGSPPDVAISHATRLVEFAPAGLLEPLDPAQLERHGIGPDEFIEKAWKLGTFNGKQYAIPLDTHPFVLYYNTKLAKQAGLLDAKGVLKDMNGQGALLDAFEAVKRKTDATGLIMETRGVTPWRLFLTLYTQLGGRPVVSADGTELTMEDDKALRALLRSTTIMVVMLQIIASLKVFDQIYLLQNGTAGPNNSTRPAIQYIYESGFTSYRLGYASALSFVFFIAIVLVSIVLFRLVRVARRADA